ncbi:MAG: acyl-CoA dehydrogenase [Rhodocyclaceae bacterium]|jgi:alkylation response protein AidB-like acyl-CoA dehydrogenase|nr:acyl-CoA dehydrogenase [Rhodocyclaceae bacterium]
MNLNLTEDQNLLLDVFTKIFTNESTLERVRAAEAAGFDGALWTTLVEVGAPLLRVPESAGGAGVGLLEAALVAEQAGRNLASVPLVEAMLAAKILGELGGETATAWLERVGSGTAMVTLALQEPVQGEPQLVPGAAVADAILVLEGDRVSLRVLAAKLGVVTNMGALPLAEAVLGGAGAVGAVCVIAEGADARAVFLAAIEEWKLLTAATLAAMARKSLEDAAAYSCERIAFDRQIGGYQGLAHPLADAVTDVDGARQLVWWTIWSLAQGKPDAAALFPMAYWWATQAAGVATVRAMRVFGGYGVSMEYPAQIYYRRSRALSMLLGDPKDELRRSADRLFNAAAAAPLPDAGDVQIDFSLGEAAEAYAASARTFFAENLTTELGEFAYRTGDGYDPALHRKLAKAGFMFPDWPKEYGGGARNPAEKSALFRVYGDSNWWITVPNTNDMVAKMIMHFGTDAAKQEILPRAGAGEVNFSLGYSEPSCGSDIFAAKTKAVKDGDDWIINGQKMFTSQGHLAQYALMAARTDPAAPKHAGITLFILPLDQPGYECTEVKTLGGERTNVTFYSDMRVPDKYRLGEVNGGAKVLAAALLLEQSGGDFFLIVLNRLYRDGCAWAKSAMRKGRPAIENDDVRLALAKLRAHVDILDAMTRWAMWSNAGKRPQRYLGPMTKLFGSEGVVRCASELMELAGPESLLQRSTPLGWIEQECRKGIAGTIYAGTSEIQRSIIAETALGMPRTRS